MTEPFKPDWPEAGAFPFMPFPLPGTAGGSTPPLMQGLTGGIELIKDFWSRLPGGAAMPGFLLPTVDVEELDRRIGDLKAAERWVEVNLGMLRTTIQGLEVQRHTIAALQALTTPVAAGAGAATAAPTGWPSPPPPSPAAAEPVAAATPPAPPSADWLAHLQAQFTKVAQAALTPAAPLAKADGAKGRQKPAGKPAGKAARGTRKTTAAR